MVLHSEPHLGGERTFDTVGLLHTSSLYHRLTTRMLSGINWKLDNTTLRNILGIVVKVIKRNWTGYSAGM